MTDATLPPPPPPPGPARMDRDTEEAIFYHESAVNAAWTGSRLAIGGLTFLFGAFAFAFFYLRALNSSGRWEGLRVPGAAPAHGHDHRVPGAGQRRGPLRGAAADQGRP